MMVIGNAADIYWNLIKEVGSYNGKWEDSLAVKSEIFIKILNGYNLNIETILFTSFNPIVVELSKKYSVTVVADASLQKLFNLHNINFVDSILDLDQQYDAVFAIDEYFTYLENEDEQRSHLEAIRNVCKQILITTLQDYKNFAPFKKNQIDTIAINNNHNYIMLENTIADKLDKQSWSHFWYCVKDHVRLYTIGPIKRRTMYFKQLAKYASDLGSLQFVVEKNLLYKGFFSKCFEHIIIVKFK